MLDVGQWMEKRKMENDKLKILDCKKKLIFLNFILFLFCLVFSSRVLRPTSYVFAQTTPSQVCFKNKCVTVEVADNDASRIRGLQGRLGLAADNGMLFVFPQEDTYNFWMKDTLIPLDMIWLNQNKQIVDIKSNVPPCQEN